jgi:hypothetical protein
MKKLILPMLVFLAACNSNTEVKKVEVKPEDIQVVEQVDNNPQAYFSATSSSPATAIDITALVTGEYVVKYTIDGVTSELAMTKEALVINGEKNMETGEVKLSGKGGSLVLAAAKCEGGTHICKLTVGDRTIEACGKFAE